MGDYSVPWPPKSRDAAVEQQNESRAHWRVKSAIVGALRSNPEYEGRIEAEKKTGDNIADIRVSMSDAPSGVPSDFVVEVETSASQKNRLQTTSKHLRYGYAVYWVFLQEAHETRRETEDILGEYLPDPPSLGIASIQDRHLELGSPIEWEEFELRSERPAVNELYVPAHERYNDWFNHGHFLIRGEPATIYRFIPNGTLYVGWHRDDGQQCIPTRAPWDISDFRSNVQSGEFERISPVRGSP